MGVAFVDIARQRRAISPGLSQAMERVIARGAFVGGPEVGQLESALSLRLGGRHAITCGSGTDALELLLRADGIGEGDAVFVPSLTFIATAEAVMLAGAVPVFVDVAEDTATLCPESLKRAIAHVRASGLGRPRAVIAVDLFSVPADAAALGAICAESGLRLFFDAAHSLGSDAPQGPCGSYGDGAGTSFYPSKALGCFGDGGAAFTPDPELAERVRAIANHGIGGPDRRHLHAGRNSRLDTLQAAVLLEKLNVFDGELAARRQIAEAYDAALAGLCGLPHVPEGTRPCWSYYAVATPMRDALKAHLDANGVASVVYYREPTHRHPAYAGCPVVPGGLPVTERFADTLLCLPVHPYMEAGEVSAVIDAVHGFFAADLPAAVAR